MRYATAEFELSKECHGHQKRSSMNDIQNLQNHVHVKEILSHVPPLWLSTSFSSDTLLLWFDSLVASYSRAPPAHCLEVVGHDDMRNSNHSTCGQF